MGQVEIAVSVITERQHDGLGVPFAHLESDGIGLQALLPPQLEEQGPDVSL